MHQTNINSKIKGKANKGNVGTHKYNDLFWWQTQISGEEKSLLRYHCVHGCRHFERHANYWTFEDKPSKNKTICRFLLRERACCTGPIERYCVVPGFTDCWTTTELLKFCHTCPSFCTYDLFFKLIYPPPPLLSDTVCVSVTNTEAPRQPSGVSQWRRGPGIGAMWVISIGLLYNQYVAHRCCFCCRSRVPLLLSKCC